MALEDEGDAGDGPGSFRRGRGPREGHRCSRRPIALDDPGRADASQRSPEKCLKVAPQPLVKGGTVIKVIEDVEFLVTRCDEHIHGEFRQFLLRCGCPPAIVSQAGY